MWEIQIKKSRFDKFNEYINLFLVCVVIEVDQNIYWINTLDWWCTILLLLVSWGMSSWKNIGKKISGGRIVGENWVNGWVMR